ncbi:MAG: SpoIID/LytB domain-containing protein, partial [Planctomycetota bacterium]|nr:SpoIID/LytB domain-containing protein [Planctomycetota bacterium]
MEPPTASTPPLPGEAVASVPPPGESEFPPSPPIVPTAPTQPGPRVLGKLPGMRVRVGADRTTATLAATGGYEIQVDGKTVTRSPDPLKPTALTHRHGLWRLGKSSWPGQTLALIPLGEAAVGLDRTLYRGSLQLHPVGSSSFMAVNHVDLDNYLAGVLPKELFKDWHEQTYRALAIAARSYAYYEATTHPKDGPYDVWDSQTSQMYGGMSAETPASLAAVRSTAGLVLMAGPPGRLSLFRTYYSSCCGGQTNPAEVLLGKNPSEALRGGVLCDDCRAATRYRWPTVRLAKRDLYHALAASFPATRVIGSLSEIRVASTTPRGRPLWLELVGPSGKTARLLADDLRLAVLHGSVPGGDKLFSMNCRLVDSGSSFEFRDGQGFGHGVGLCQWGAQGKARLHWPAEKILLHYYP